VAVIHFGGDARRNVVDLDAAEASRFLGRETIEFDEADPRGQLPNRGYVIARYLGVPIGCGLWRRGTLASSVPKGRALPELELPMSQGAASPGSES
jgi:NOL1/NOP2/fmu family ribosome biogenesis protein